MQAILRKRVNNKKGVTLVELLAVLVILGIIALIAVPAIAGVIDDSKENSIKSTAINMINAAELYATTNNTSTVNYSDISGNYVKERDGIKWSGGPQFDLSGDEVKITGTANIGEDDVSVIFRSATVNDINNSEGRVVDGN